MKYKNAIITLGILIAISLSPFIGIPRSWKEGIAIVLALFVSMLAYIGSRVKVQKVLPVSPSDTVVSSETNSSNTQ